MIFDKELERFMKLYNPQDPTLIKRQLYHVTDRNDWSNFCEVFQLDPCGMSAFATKLGFVDAEHMINAMTPRRLLWHKGRNFLNVLKATSIVAKTMEDSEILNRITIMWNG